MTEIAYATVEDDAETVPPELRCIWPGCTRRRAPGRSAGSGRQKEYCLKADRPETGGSPVHNARNRWAWHRAAENTAAESTPADGAAEDTAGRRDAAGTVAGGQVPPPVPDNRPVSAARHSAAELLERARRQQAGALAALRAERELYGQLAERFRVMTDPAAVEEEITAVRLKSGRDVSQADEEAAAARRAQLAAERERDQALRLKEDADAAAEQFAEDTGAAERALAERTAEFERDRDLLLRRAREAEERADRAVAQAEAAKAAADSTARTALARAAEAAADARRQTAEARQQAADQASAARADAGRARAEAERARQETERARADAGAARESFSRALDDARARITAAETSAATADARAAALQAEIERLRDERAAELARLEAAHNAALGAERARANRAEGELDALRAGSGE